MSSLPHRLRVALVSAAVFVVAVTLAVAVDQKPMTAPVMTTSATAATATATVPAALPAAAPNPRVTPSPRPEGNAERRRERRRARRFAGAVPAQPTPSPTRPTQAPGADEVMGEWAEEQATAAARQNERIQDTIDTGTSLELTRAAETIDRMQQTAAAEIQAMCEPQCLGSASDAGYP